MTDKYVCVCAHCNVAFVHCEVRRRSCLSRLLSCSFHCSRDGLPGVSVQAALTAAKCRGWWKWCKTFFIPSDVTFAWGLICILVRCAGTLLLLPLAGLYYPDKTRSFKRFGAFAVLPLLFFSSCILPLFFFGLLVHFSPSVLFSLELFCILPILSLFLFCPLCQPHLCASVWCLLNVAIEVGEFGWRKQNYQLSVCIISGISGSAQSNGLKRIVTRWGQRQVIPGLLENNPYWWNLPLRKRKRTATDHNNLLHKDFPQSWFPRDLIDTNTYFVSGSVSIHKPEGFSFSASYSDVHQAVLDPRKVKWKF